jgi:SAM-dependent methyltransferase
VNTFKTFIGAATGYRAHRWLYKRRQRVDGPRGQPDAPWANAVLQTQAESSAATEQVRKLGLPLSDAATKNWDSLAALDLLLKNTRRSARIFDAGGEHYSMILPWLWLYGYRNLIAGNISFKGSSQLGPIRYEYADITRTGYPDACFDAVTCLSVIEHGVDLAGYFHEMARIIAPEGLLITSTDYWETSVDTRGQSAYGVPIHVFTKREILGAISTAESLGFKTLGPPLELACNERVVHWQPYDLKYTFVVFALRRRGAKVVTS